MWLANVLTLVLAMPCCIRMQRFFLQGLLWLYLYGFGLMVLSLEPGFLDFDNLPDTNFSCVGKVIGGYYADLETNCQMFHVCTIGQLDDPMDIRFLCLNGTVFDQETRVCERIDEVDCTKSEQYYSLNLELYGHSQSSNLEENSETESLIIKSTPTTTTPLPRKTTRSPYYTSISPPLATTLRTKTHHISSHHFPILNPSASDIRFNPEEINISLHPGAPPDIRTKGPVSYYSDKKITNSNSDHHLGATTNRAVYNYEGNENSETSTRKSINHRYNSITPGDVGEYGLTYSQEDSGEYTEPPESYRIFNRFQPSQEYTATLQNYLPQRYKSSTYRSNNKPSTQTVENYQQKFSTTTRNYFIHSLQSYAPNQQNHYGEDRSEKSPQRIQLPLPLLPTLPPLTFSSPAPFSLQQRHEQKRYTKDHIPPPRIVISASASVSDASGKKLNYSLGTIGAAQLFKPPPSTYDEYKDEDVALDPFYLDVPKVKGTRNKRSVTLEGIKIDNGRAFNYSDIIKSDEEALHVLKFLFDWYKNEKTNPARFTTPFSAPLDNEGISSINHELAPKPVSINFKEGVGDSFNFKVKTNDFNKKISYMVDTKDEVNQDVKANVKNVREKYSIEHELDNKKEDNIFQDEDYINDTHEPLTYKETEYEYFSNQEPYTTEQTLNSKQNMNFSLADLYIEENYEHTNFKEREPEKSFSQSNTNIVERKTTDYIQNIEYKKPVIKEGKTEYEHINNISEHINKKKEYKTHFDFDKDNLKYLSQLPYRESMTTEHPKEEKNTNKPFFNYTTTSAFENLNYISLKQNNESLLKNNKSNERDIRKFTNIINGTDKKFDFKLVVIDKLVEKPYRAKDDYDFLKTIQNQTPTQKNQHQTIKTKEISTITVTDTIPTITKASIVTSSSIELNPIQTNTVSNFILTTAPSISTVKPKIKPKRGKFKFRDYSSEVTILPRRDKSQHQTEVNKYENLEKSKYKSNQFYPDLNNNYQGNSQYYQIISSESDSKEPYSEILESVTKQFKIERSKVLSDEQVLNADIVSKSNISTTLFPTDAPSEKTGEKNIIDTIHMPNSNINVFTIPFTPTTETTPITKQNNFKDNLLNTEFFKTTEIVTETTEKLYDTITWLPEKLKQMVQNIQSNTKSVVASKIFKKLTEANSTVKTAPKSKSASEKLIYTFTENTANIKNNQVDVTTAKTNNLDKELDKTNTVIYYTTEVLKSNKISNLNLKKENNNNIRNTKIKETSVNSIKEQVPSECVNINNCANTLNVETTSEENGYTQTTSTLEHISILPTTLIQTSTETNQPTTLIQFSTETNQPTTLIQTSTETNQPTTLIQFLTKTNQPKTLTQTSTETIQETTTELTTTIKSKRRYNKSESKQKLGDNRHRFRMYSFTKRPESWEKNIEDKIVEMFKKEKDYTTESYRENINKKEYKLTDYPLKQSVNPTQAEKAFVTTPFSYSYSTKKYLFFNCFGKETNKFYPDLRDCRLFHYCTQGYNKNQLIDMKFVCDLNTYFDNEKLICTKLKPKRCS